MCLEHYHEVYCRYCLHTVGVSFTGKRIYCDEFKKNYYCNKEEYEVCRDVRTKAPKRFPRPTTIYAHECARDDPEIPLVWQFREMLTNMRKRLGLPLCQFAHD